MQPLTAFPRLAALGAALALALPFGASCPKPAAIEALAAQATGSKKSAAQPKGPLGQGPAIGVNLVYQAYWSSQIPFVDLFKLSSPWLPQRADSWEWDTKEPLDLDEQGWVRRLAPGQAAGTLMARGLGGRYPGGVYQLYYDGVGRLELLQDAKVIDQARGRLSVKVDPSDAGIHLKLVATDPKDPLRNIRLIQPGFEKRYEKEPFRPDFLEFLKPFSTIRFMDWQRTNGSSIEHFEQRITPEHQTQASDLGVAWEHAVDLINRLDKDAWFCVPHLADDACVRALAELVFERVDPGRTVFVELSNEVWNDTFSQARWAERSGLERELSKNPFEARLRRYSERSVEVLDLWAEVWKQDPKKPLVRVLAGQSANPWTGEVILGFKDAKSHADAYAVAPYFGGGLGAPERVAEVSAKSQPALFALLEKDLDEVLEQTRQNARIARLAGLPLIAYEGGQHLAGYGGAQNSRELVARFHQANTNPLMAELYGRYLAGWKAAGGRLFCHWNSIEPMSEWGSWGLVEFVDQPRDKAPKLDGLLRFSSKNPRWW